MSRRTLEFGCGIIVVGLLAGVAGLSTTLLLRAVEHLTYHYSFGTLLSGVTGSSPVRRALGPMVGGALAGFGWWMLRRRTEMPPLAETIASHRPIPRLPLSIDAGLQVLIVGSGASLGREGAPRQFAAALGDLGTSRWSLTARDREILLACAAGRAWPRLQRADRRRVVRRAHPAGLLAPTGRGDGADHVGAGRRGRLSRHARGHTVGLARPAVVLSANGFRVAAVTAGARRGSGVQPDHGACAASENHQVMAADTGDRRRRPVGRYLLGVVAGAARQRESILTVSLNSGLTLSAAVVILFLKPLITAAFLRAGAVGGMLTPALATGAAMGSVVALSIDTWTELAVSVPAVSLTCAAGVLAITQRAPVWAAIFVWELARPPWWLLAPFLVAALAAHGLKVLADRPSPRSESG